MITILYFRKLLFLMPMVLLFITESDAQNIINGKLWLDYDADGNINGFDPGISQVPVFLVTCTGQMVQSTLTDSNGDYAFSNVADGDYKLFFNKSSLASEYRFTRIGPGFENSAFADGYTACSSINEDSAFNAGLTILSSIGDQVWEDINGNGLREPSENGISNVTVNLFNNDDFLVAQTMTNSIGRYIFSDIFPGSYYIEFLPNPIYVATKSVPIPTFRNSDISNASGRNLTQIYEIVADQAINDIDAGFYRCAEFCGTIYYDRNGDNLFQTNENGINNLEIQIWQVNGLDTVLYSYQLTRNKPNTPSDDGFYSFCVPPGDYFLKVIIPDNADLVAGLPQIGINPTIYNHINQSNGVNTTSTKNVTSGSINCNINNGFSCRGFIVVTVWLDENHNGIRENGEELLNNVSIVLNDINRTEIKTVLTNNLGVARFDSIPRGQYYIFSAVDNQYIFTQPLAANDADIDSDIEGIYGYGTTTTLDLRNCQKINNIGAGVVLRPLPVVWGDRWVKSYERYNLIHWEAISERNSEKYAVLKSKNGITGWETVGELKAKNNGQPTTYEITDTQYYPSLTYYKIVAFDYDGKSFDSGILYSERGSELYKDNLNMDILPNPATNEVNIQVSKTDDEAVYSILIIDNNGRVIKTQPLGKSGLITINVTDLSNGLYNVLLVLDFKTVAKQNLVIQK